MNDRTCVPPIDPQPATCDPGRPRRGAPSGNTNARVHGCRSPRLVEAWRRILKEHTDYGVLDREVLLAMLQLGMVNSRGATTLVALRLSARLGRLVRIKYGVHLDDLEALENAFKRVAFDLPLTKEVSAKLAEAFLQPEGEFGKNSFAEAAGENREHRTELRTENC